MNTKITSYHAKILKRRWLSLKAFEITLSRSSSFQFQSGQRICVLHGKTERDYSPVSDPGDPDLTLCIRHVQNGRISSILSNTSIGTQLTVSGPYGYFTYKPSPRPAVLVATGTGIAPFCSMVKAGAKEFILLHGVADLEDLYYKKIFRSAAKLYVPCLSKSDKAVTCFKGRVTEYIKHKLPPAAYDFYLCGRREMVRDVTLLVDEYFPDSLVYSEIFF